ncbi:unnamed protein product [Microthlaspi erraticum]|uniref:DUF674 domain-containing protein n=1 Tax=Microthlaspi erraticum TaxID=1685480 RepID=A0A6D2I6I9_9BRAS|nr:unnamed protein product [Microthlaspi erraticum]
MAGAQSSAKPKPMFSLRLVVDKKKNKFVLAQAGRNFVDVLFSILTLPMGTIVRLLEKYQQNQKSKAATIGCFNNLYKSVHDLSTASFMKEVCKDMLLHPRSVMENQRRGLKLNVDDIEDLKYYMCTTKDFYATCRPAYSNFSSSRCYCGQLMAEQIEYQEGLGCKAFVSEKTLFTISDNMKVGFTTTGFTLKTLESLGYTDFNQLHEMLEVVDHGKIVESDAVHTLFRNTLDRCVLETELMCNDKDAKSSAKSSRTSSTWSGKDFVDLLFTFLVLPLNSAWKLSGSDVVLGCIGNLFESVKGLSSSNSSNTLTGKCVLPWYYSCQQTLLDVSYEDLPPVMNYNGGALKPMDPRVDKIAEGEVISGFVKGGMTFMISDDLIITPFSSTICSLKKWKLDLDDIEEHVIKISKTEAITLLRASLMTSTALTTAFGSLLPKKPKEEMI